MQFFNKSFLRYLPRNHTFGSPYIVPLFTQCVSNLKYATDLTELRNDFK